MLVRDFQLPSDVDADERSGHFVACRIVRLRFVLEEQSRCHSHDDQELCHGRWERAQRADVFEGADHGVEADLRRADGLRDDEWHGFNEHDDGNFNEPCRGAYLLEGDRQGSDWSDASDDIDPRRPLSIDDNDHGGGDDRS